MDAGDFLFSVEQFSGHNKKTLSPAAARFMSLVGKAGGNNHEHIDKEILEAQLLLDFYRDIGYTVAGVGQKDLCAGVDFLKREAGKRGITLLSANLSGKGHKIFSTDTVIEKNGVRIGFTAVTSCNVVKYHREEMECTAPAAALVPIVNRLKNKCDFVVLLSNVQDSKNRNIVHSIDGIDLIIKSGKGVQTYQPEMYETVPAVMTHPKGKSIGAITIKKDKQGTVEVKNNLVLLTGKFPVDKAAQARVDAFSRKCLKRSALLPVTGRPDTAGSKKPHGRNATMEDKPAVGN